MEKQFLLENETVTIKSDNGSIYLTNLRLLKNENQTGKGYFMSMHLKSISTIEIKSTSSPLLILLAVLCVFGGAMASQNNNSVEMIYAGVGLAFIFFLLYFFTRYHLINVTSTGGTKMNFKARRMKKEAVLNMVKKSIRLKLI